MPRSRITASAKRRICKIGRGIFLIDSGAQYEDGTTDITRTMVVGRPSAEMRDRFTRVLKGHIAIARAVFPPGTTRRADRRAGARRRYGAPASISTTARATASAPISRSMKGRSASPRSGTTALAPGMIISNEPGYYAPGKFGIRIENLVVVEERAIAGAERKMLGFETISFAPIDQRLIEPKLLDEDEIAWLNAYHAKTRAVAAAAGGEPETRAWLREATRRV